MEASNISVQLYFVTPHSPEEVRDLVGKALGCNLERPDLEAYYDEIAFRGGVLGITFILQFLELWSESQLYRLTGTSDDLYMETEKITSIDFHIAQLLRNQGISQIMTRAEFSDEYQRRNKTSDLEKS
jgi:hypothetical protein